MQGKQLSRYVVSAIEIDNKSYSFYTGNYSQNF